LQLLSGYQANTTCGPSSPGTPPTTTAAGHIEHYNFARHTPMIPPRVSTASESGAEQFSAD
jgi:hypothetical protein